MIRHRPFGSEHPYALSDDQRVPVRPLVGEEIELRVMAPGNVSQVSCEWVIAGSVHTLKLWPSSAEPAGPSVPGEGAASSHLSAAAKGPVQRGRRWSARVSPLGPGQSARYRFVGVSSEGQLTRTRWFTVTPAAWDESGGQINVTGPDRVVPGSLRWLTDGTGTWRVRFALPLAPAEHVVGFGERYDRQDQRGHVLDCVVFEQYKGQSAVGRTYLPMPFAHVIGGSGWGFYVKTSRRTWFDIGSSSTDQLLVEAELGGGPDERLELAVFEGDPNTVISAFLRHVGRPKVLPGWVHRLWASGNEWNTQRRVLDEVERHEKEDVPVGVVVIEAWSDERTFVVFRDAEYEVHPDGPPIGWRTSFFPPTVRGPTQRGSLMNCTAAGCGSFFGRSHFSGHGLTLLDRLEPT